MEINILPSYKHESNEWTHLHPSSNYPRSFVRSLVGLACRKPKDMKIRLSFVLRNKNELMNG
ncbi:hypothetical protein BLOT_010367 [Blomia tropicalis]|nr:hypothetical protein BLOT_010367 [Blomia tropicalis]